MSKSLNKVMLIGRLGADPEIRYTPDGVAIANFRMATNRPVRQGEEWGEETDWHRVVAFRRLGEIAGEYLSKGSQVYVEGRLQTRSWEDQDGNTRWITEVVARELILLDSKGARQSDGAADLEPPPPPVEDDVPF